LAGKTQALNIWVVGGVRFCRCDHRLSAFVDGCTRIKRAASAASSTATRVRGGVPPADPCARSSSGARRRASSRSYIWVDGSWLRPKAENVRITRLIIHSDGHLPCRARRQTYNAIITARNWCQNRHRNFENCSGAV
jgi:hypothetical protein